MCLPAGIRHNGIMEKHKEENRYLNPAYESLLHYHQLDDFDRLWELEAEWFEEPNRRRGGWSGVCRLELQGKDGQVVPVFLKRQENHRARTLRHPFKGIPTVRRELQNMLRFHAEGLPVPEILYGADRICRGQVQGILLTRELTGYRSLDDFLGEWYSLELSESLLEQLLFPPLVAMIRTMHQRGFRYNCLYGKHIFVQVSPALSAPGGFPPELEEPQLRLSFIDLEKVRQSCWKKRNIVRDLSQLKRHTNFSPLLWERFLDRYLDFLSHSAWIRAALGRRRRSRN